MRNYGGAFYEPAIPQFPQEYNGAYFYADFCVGLDSDSSRPNDAGSQLFATFTYFPVDLKVAKNGTLYYLERGLDSPTPKAQFSRLNLPSQKTPVITQQPANVTVAAGQPASFTVQASGSAPLSYQWQRNGINLDGPSSNTPTLNIRPPNSPTTAPGMPVLFRINLVVLRVEAAQLTVVAGTAPVATMTLPATRNAVSRRRRHSIFRNRH